MYSSTPVTSTDIYIILAWIIDNIQVLNNDKTFLTH